MMEGELPSSFGKGTITHLPTSNAPKKLSWSEKKKLRKERLALFPSENVQQKQVPSQEREGTKKRPSGMYAWIESGQSLYSIFHYNFLLISIPSF